MGQIILAKSRHTCKPSNQTYFGVRAKNRRMKDNVYREACQRAVSGASRDGVCSCLGVAQTLRCRAAVRGNKELRVLFSKKC